MNPAPALATRALGSARTDEPEQRAERFRARLSERIGSHRFGLWFEHGTAIAIARSSITVTAANAYVRDWIIRNFRESLEQIAGEVVGPDCSVDVAIAEATEPSLRGGCAPAPVGVARGGNPDIAPSRSSSDDPRRRTSAPRQATLRRLDDFVVGEANRLAYAASRQLGEGAAEAPSILFIHGECGVGKTHLLQGLCRRRSERAPRQLVKYLTAEQFTNEYIAAVRDGSLDAFRKRLRRVDLLAIDDVHFFANKTATQAEFLHTVDAIDLSGARVAIVSDEHPRHIRRFSQSLVSRFLSGMVVKVDRPDRGTRLELVRRLARERGLDLTAAAEDSVAGRCTGSIREIEGAITRLGALVELDGMRGQIGPGTVDRLLGEELGPVGGALPIRLGHIVEAVCDRLRVSREDLLGNGRHPRTVAARGLVAHLSRELTTHSYPEIARALGRDTHSAVHTAAKRVKSMIDGDHRLASDGEPVRELVDQLRHDIVRASRNRPL
jgi:chromosomal replication initiator protein